GTPPRQTEDPLSPPCVAFFDGNNGGATAKGVSKDEIRVVLVTMAGQDSRRERTFVDCSVPPQPSDSGNDHACHAFARYFEQRYQTYNRRVQVWNYYAVSSNTVWSQVVADIDEKQPFAIVAVAGQNSGASIANHAYQRGILTAMYQGTRRESYAKGKPYYIGFRPDMDSQAALAASFICIKLKDGPARFAGDVTWRSRPRRFGIFYQADTVQPAMLRDELRKQCDIEIAKESNANSATTAGAEMRSAEITTAILYASSPIVPMQSATNAGWFPEWVVPGQPYHSGIDTNRQGRLADPNQWRSVIGLTPDYRRDELVEQHWYRAYREGCPDCPAPSTVNDPYVYDAFSMLFYGIQASGPRLSADNVSKGIAAIPANRSASPYKPAAYFEPGNYSYVKDAAAIWWDPQGQAPGDGQMGCYRLVGGGQRYRVGEWPSGDADLGNRSDPCQGNASVLG
ncbi:MAG TPA: hypothetical protein VM840_06330, partial [Actinomycetota bacterium]|nr:hypothetical protein [Actinomycetota bacterium]